VGSALCRALRELEPQAPLFGLDNLMRPGSEQNRILMRHLGVRFFHGDQRSAVDVAGLPPVDWVIDAAAIPDVRAGLGDDSFLLMEHNVLGTLNLLEYCRRHGAGLLLLSSSRVYSIYGLRSLPLKEESWGYRLDGEAPLPAGVSEKGLAADFSTEAPVSLYGATKLAAERLAQEYGEAFGLPVWITRCGILAGAGQFGTPRQGIIAYWIHAHR
jgi:CDP-paratose 2-epimerase